MDGWRVMVSDKSTPMALEGQRLNVDSLLGWFRVTDSIKFSGVM